MMVHDPAGDVAARTRAQDMTSLGYAIAARGRRFSWFEAPDYEWARREWGRCP